MKNIPAWRRYLRFFGPDVKSDVETELTFHLDMRTEELVEKGWRPSDARAEALRCFGNRAAITSACRSTDERHLRQHRLRRVLEDALHDLAFVCRVFARTPGMATVILLTLALGVGANAAVFSLVQAVVLRPLPFDRPEQLAMVWGRLDRQGVPQNAISEPEYWDLRDSTRSFDELAALHVGRSGNLTGTGGNPERVTILAATTGLLPLLGVQPSLGRGFHAHEDQPTGTRVAMVGEGFWRGRMAADATIIGRTVQIDAVPFVIIGVVPASFRFPGTYDLFIPLTLDRLNPGPREEHQFGVVGRLKGDVTLSGANTELGALASRLRTQYPAWYGSDSGFGLYAVGLHEQLVGGSRLALLCLMGAAAFVLLVACANVTNLLLARTSARERELAIRRALGAGRARLVRQSIAEGCLLGALGGALGLVLAWWSASVVRGLDVEVVSRLDQVRIDTGVLVYTIVVSLLLGVASSVLPWLRLTGGRLQTLLASRGTGGAGAAGKGRAQSALVVVQVALALVLLTGANLMIRTVWHLASVDPGFDPRGVLAFQVALPESLYADRPAVVGFYERALDRLGRAPGVRVVGTVSALPLTGEGDSGTVFIESTPVTNLPRSRALSLPMLEADQRVVSPGYMEAMRLRLVRGRLFSGADRGGAALVAIVDAKLAARIWPGLDPIGRRVAVDATQRDGRPVMRWQTVVGVVEHVRQAGLTAAGREQIYMPVYQRLDRQAAFAVRTAGDPAALVPVIRREIAAVDPGLAAYRVRPMVDIVGESIQAGRLTAGLLATLALLALTLAVAGTYGVMAYAVDRRGHEIGVRLALGARRAQVLRLILGRGLLLSAAGAAAGVGLTLGATRAMAGLVAGVSTLDPVSLIAAVVVLQLAAGLAVAVPARRATHVDPLVVLRDA